MSETSNIALMAKKLSEEVFSEFFWTKVGPEDQDWPCEDMERHGVKTHPADVVFYYEEPYSQQRTFVHCDLKSYAKGSITPGALQGAIASLSKQIACAEKSDVWRSLYMHIDIDEEVSNAEEKMLGVVENVALSGENLVASEMYQELKEKGFFITSITWRAKQQVDPYAIIECDAGFEDRQAGKKFRYSIHGALKFKNGRYTKNIRPVKDDEKADLLAMIERTARSVLARLQAEAEASNSDEGGAK